MEDLRRLLMSYAYNILGSWEDAKDIVQDVFLKFSQLDEDKIADRKSYLIRMVVNLAIDQKRRLKKERDNYPGHWLPEPIATDDPNTAIDRKEILSYSMLVLLEKLDSKQRAVFILKEAFDYAHDEIASVLGITIESSRKILSRAKSELRSQQYVAPDKSQMKVLDQYLAVLESGDMGELEQLLTDEVTATSDGGGKAPAFRHIITGARSVSALLAGLHKKTYTPVNVEITRINHQPAIFYFFEGRIITCQIFSVQNQHIENIFFIRNPDKLKTLQKLYSERVTISPRSSS
ncbi:MAG: sigma-70 family RNA polymerase sigma factor [Bacteroidota bacterium]|nr:sigma-70 family RNA polymerase sigma factor [Bacteroidota bacterium]